MATQNELNQLVNQGQDNLTYETRRQLLTKISGKKRKFSRT